METWFYSNTDGNYWCAVGLPVGGVEELLAGYPEGTIQITAPPRHGDSFDGANWLPAPEPTIEEKRAAMPSLSARQFRLGLIEGGILLSQVDAAIEAITEPLERNKAQVAWEYAVEFERLNPLVLSMSAALGLSDEDVDGLWEMASAM